jgi:hypothetical protein
MKSNAQLRHETQGGVPQPPPNPPPVAASSSQAVPPSFDIEAAFTQLMSSMGALQREVNLIEERVEQCQIDIRECLQYHHPKTYVFINTPFTLCHCMTKMGSIFWFLDRECISKPVKYFCPRMAKWGVFSILCWLHSG